MDIRTLLFANLVLQLSCGLGLSLMGRRVAGFQGLSWFSYAYACAAIGVIVVVQGDVYYLGWVAVLGRCVMLLSAVLLTQGVAEYSLPGSSALGWGWFLMAVCAAAEVSLLARGSGGAVSAVVAFCMAFAAQLTIAIMLLYAHEQAAERSACRFTALLLATIAGLFLVRGLSVTRRLSAVALLSPDSMRFGAVAIYMLLSVALAFAFVWMVTARLRQQLETQARIDALTGVLNRGALEIVVADAMASCRGQSLPLTLVALDLDRFKSLNDQFGHGAGDAMLVAAARLLSRSVRDTDMVARFGGEEFIVVLSGRTAARGIEIAERLRERIAALEIAYEGHSLGVTASFGVSTMRPEDSWNDLLRRADRGLYTAKQAGRNRVVFDDTEATPAPLVRGQPSFT
ncbi:MAG TPA: GGDEF domain-containing protein [Terriglobales bacterium]|nr:GGDEF domain-containing protein [Terriglobales bacterium]